MASKTVVQLPDSLCLRDMSLVHARLSEILLTYDSIALSIPDDASIDLSFVQLVESARLKADMSGKTLTLAQSAQGNLKSILERSGILTDAADGDIRFWLQAERAQ